jgi:hypothetical protein
MQNALNFSLHSKLRQTVAPATFAAALETEAERWLKLDADDPGVGVLRMAARVIERLGAELQASLAAERESRTLTKQALAAAQGLERVNVDLRAANVALSAAAARQPSASRTQHWRDKDGELVESRTVFEFEARSAAPPAAEDNDARSRRRAFFHE